MKTDVAIPTTFWRLADRRGGDNCLGPTPGFHAFVRTEMKHRSVYRSLCGWEVKSMLGYGTRVGRPPVGDRCGACDTEEQKLHMRWTPLPADTRPPRKGGGK